MIAYNFDYYLPETVEEAVELYASLQRKGLKPYYYGGGTEIISMSRVFNIKPDAVIDIKKIPDCSVFGAHGHELHIGAAVTLSKIYESGLCPLLGLAANRIADHTIQVRLTLGGNLAGTIIYRETLLPLMLADSHIFIADAGGTYERPIMDVLAPHRGLRPGELIVKVSLDRAFASLPYAHIKKTRSAKIGYPLVTLCAVLVGNVMRLAASGLINYPIRFTDISIDNDIAEADLAESLLSSLPGPLLDDVSGSSQYREFVFKKTAESIIQAFRTRV